MASFLTINSLRLQQHGPATGTTSDSESTTGLRNSCGNQYRRDLVACAFISVLWVLPLLLIRLHGEFPLNDDWAHARPVKTFIETGQFTHTDWTWVPLITHTLLGSAFSELLGFSFENLRLVGFIMGWVGIIGTYVLCRQNGASSPVGLFAAAILAFNPLYFNLSYTFMTEVPFTALIVWSVVFLVHGIKRRSYAAYAAGFFLIIAATLSRQFAVAIAAGCASTLVITRPKNPWRWGLAFLVVISTTATYLALPSLLYADRQIIKGDLHFFQNVLRQKTELYHVFWYGTRHYMYLGLLLSPFTFVVVPSYRGARGRLTVAGVLLAMLVMCGVIWRQWQLPGMNIIYDFGVGPMEVVRGACHLPRAMPSFWWLISGLAVTSASLLAVFLLAFLWQERHYLRTNPILILLLTCTSAYILIVLTQHFDRYIIPIVPLVLVVFLFLIPSTARLSRPGPCAGIILLVLTAAFSILGTRDYLVRHRVRWSMLSSLTKAGVMPDRIDGGFEFNAWHNDGDPRITHKTRRSVIDNEYIASYEPSIPGYTMIDQEEYLRLLPPGYEALYLYQRQTSGHVGQPSLNHNGP